MSLLSRLFGKSGVLPEQAPSVQRAPNPILGSAKPFTIPSGPFRFIALDVETANSNSSSICQIGLACVRGDGSIHVVSSLIDPEQPFSDFNVNLHGIGPAKVRGAPKFPAIFEQISSILEQQPVIQHSAFDRGAVNGACMAYGVLKPEWQWADSVQIARRAWPEFRGNGGHGLGHLKQALDLDFAHHDAGEDAKAAAMVVLKAEAHTGQSLDELTSTKKSQPKPKPSVVALSITEAKSTDLSLHIERLAALVGHLNKMKPLSCSEVDKLWKAESNKTISWMMETGESYGETAGAPDFLNQPRSEFQKSLRSIDNDLGAQIEIVDTACRAYFTTGETPAPYYAWRIVVILSRAKKKDHERAFLAAWCRHFANGNGARYRDLVVRAQKRGIEI